MFVLNNGVYVLDIANDFKGINTITKNTANTWQKNRPVSETKMNTHNGKRAEQAVEQVLHNIGVNYLQYDKFRTDELKKHAPFDGLIINNSVVKLSKFISKINEEIKKGNFGKLSSDTLEELIINGIYPVEIKSTQIGARHLTPIENNMQKKLKIEEEIAENILMKDDFLTYPFFIRSYNENVNLQWYFKMVNGLHPSCDSLDKLLNFEKKNQAYFHIRVYQKGNRFYVMKFITRDEFFDKKNLEVKKMFQIGKSESAVYFAKTMKQGQILDEITNYL